MRGGSAHFFYRAGRAHGGGHQRIRSLCLQCPHAARYDQQLRNCDWRQFHWHGRGRPVPRQTASGPVVKVREVQNRPLSGSRPSLLTFDKSWFILALLGPSLLAKDTKARLNDCELVKRSGRKCNPCASYSGRSCLSPCQRPWASRQPCATRRGRARVVLVPSESRFARASSPSRVFPDGCASQPEAGPDRLSLAQP